jgi:hypothetical protein
MHFGIKNTLKNNHNHLYFLRSSVFEIVIINYNLNYFLFKNILKKLLKKKRRKVANLHVCKWKCG